MAEIVAVPYKDGKVLLKIPEIRELQNIDIEKVTKIQVDKLVAELLTFPVILNRLGLILIEAESAVSRAELALKIGKADLAKKASGRLLDEGEKVTENNVMHWIRRQPKYKELNDEYIEAVRKKGIVNSAYWSAKAKNDTLNALSKEIKRDELVIEDLVSEINGIKLVVKSNVI